MMASLPFAKRTMMLAVSYASGPSRSLISGEIWQDPLARTATGSESIRNLAISRSWMAMSLKIPPPPLTYFSGGGSGSREQSFTTMGSPMVPSMSDCFTRAKLGSKRRWRAVMSFTPLSRHRLTALIVSESSVAIGFSQKMSLPAMAHAVICCAWNCEGEQIHTASTSGWLMTSMSESVHAIPGYVAAAAFAFEMVGFEMMIGLAAGHEESASRWTSPIRPAPMMPTPMRRSSRAASFSESEMSE
mmetsp:Transcript_14011/g.42746  ORF Transcript_14011/g.42746 Transcript_14011/m.42746 type:complete len:245 (-) Transcript_14011:107-841(-)